MARILYAIMPAADGGWLTFDYSRGTTMKDVIDLILEAAKEYAATTPEVWDDLVLKIVERFLRRKGFIEALQARATAAGVTLPTFPASEG